VTGAAGRWSKELAAWAIPEQILAQAPEPPWPLPPALFRVNVSSHRVIETPSTRLARAGLPEGGSILDVGCGGGAASLPLAPWAATITGVDQDDHMLANFASGCRELGVGHVEIRGDWPRVADAVAGADLVLSHHVVYNVADIVPFLEALTRHARRLVVVELTETHPTSPFNPLWERFWGLSRPTEPTAGLFIQVLKEMGLAPRQKSHLRTHRTTSIERSEYVAFARRRLCLGPERDEEVDDALGDTWPLEVSRTVSVAWAPRASEGG